MLWSFDKAIEDIYEPGDNMAVDFDIALNLGLGLYTLAVAVPGDATHLMNNYDSWDKVIGFQIVPSPEPAPQPARWHAPDFTEQAALSDGYNDLAGREEGTRAGLDNLDAEL